jgi:predicted amino acid-binding ACT domain protein
MTRDELIRIYTKFVSMFMLQEIKNFSGDPLRNSLEFATLKELSLVLKLQSEDVVRHMLMEL